MPGVHVGVIDNTPDLLNRGIGQARNRLIAHACEWLCNLTSRTLAQLWLDLADRADALTPRRSCLRSREELQGGSGRPLLDFAEGKNYALVATPGIDNNGLFTTTGAHPEFAQQGVAE